MNQFFSILAAATLVGFSGIRADEPATSPAVPAPAGATDEAARSVNPGINKGFLDPQLNIGEWVNRFEVESREVFTARVQILKALKLKEGDTVADIGAGTGLFMVAMSKAVGSSGKVYAVDISEAFVKHLIHRKAELELGNVEPVLCGDDDVNLPPASVDVAFVCDTYHHFEFPAPTLQSILRALKPGGRLVVVDFERIPGTSSEWTLNHVRAGKDTFAAEIESSGFGERRELEVPGLHENYCLEFVRPE